jgi:hypothetical protein
MQKQGRGQPRGSKKKPKEVTLASPLASRLCGLPLGSGNKVIITAVATTSMASSSALVAAAAKLSQPAPAYQSPAYELVGRLLSFFALVLVKGLGASVYPSSSLR